MLLNGKYENGQIYHITYSPDYKVFGEVPTSGELTIHSHEMTINLPKEIEQKKETLKRRTMGRGFLSVKQSAETI